MINYKTLDATRTISKSGGFLSQFECTVKKYSDSKTVISPRERVDFVGRQNNKKKNLIYFVRSPRVCRSNAFNNYTRIHNTVICATTFIIDGACGKTFSGCFTGAIGVVDSIKKRYRGPYHRIPVLFAGRSPPPA